MTRPSNPSPTPTSMTRPVRSTSSPALQMPVLAEQHDPDFVLIDVKRNAKHIAGELYQLLKSHIGEPRYLGNAVAMLVILPTSRGVSVGVNASRPCFMAANVRSRTLCKFFRLWGHWLFASGFSSYPSLRLRGSTLASGLCSPLGSGFNSALTSGLGSTLVSGLSFSFRSSSTPLSSAAR